MIIDGTSIESIYGSKVEFLDYEIPNPSYNRFVTVTDNDRKIVNKRASVGINNIKVRMVIHETKENAYVIISGITSLLGDALVNFGGDITYRVQVAVDGMFELKAGNMFLWTVQLQVLDKMGEEVSVTTTDDAVIVENLGTYKAPIVIELVPTTTADIGIAGFGAHPITNPLTIVNVVAGNDITIDGEQCLLLEDISGTLTNKFIDSNLTTFPEIPVGETTLLFTPTGISKTIRFRPRFI